MAWELCTFADLKKFLGLTGTAIADYPALEVIKPSVEYAIEKYLGRQLETTERTETFYLTGPTAMVSLKALPVASVSSLSITMPNGSTGTYTVDDYYITQYGLATYVDLNDAKVEITYTGGIGTDVADVFNNINRAAVLQTSFEFQTKDNVGAETVSMEGGSTSRPELGLLKEVKRLLAEHLHPLKTTG